MIFRAFYGIPQTMRGPDGALVNAVRGSMDNLARYITERKPRHVAVTTDEDWRPDWRVGDLPRHHEHRPPQPALPAPLPPLALILEWLVATRLGAIGPYDLTGRVSLSPL